MSNSLNTYSYFKCTRPGVASYTAYYSLVLPGKVRSCYLHGRLFTCTAWKGQKLLATRLTTHLYGLTACCPGLQHQCQCGNRSARWRCRGHHHRTRAAETRHTVVVPGWGER